MANSLRVMSEIPRTKGIVYTVPQGEQVDIYGAALINNQQLSGNNVDLFLVGNGVTAANTPQNSGIYHIVGYNFSGYQAENNTSFVSKTFPVAHRMDAGDSIVAQATLTGSNVILFGKKVYTST